MILIKSIRYLLTIACLSVVLPYFASGQACADYHARACPIPDFSFFYDQQSASFSLKVGETAEVRMIVFEVTDYFMSVCSHRRFNNTRLRIIEDTPERKLLYDNSSENYIDSVKFTNDITRKLILEVSVPLEGNDESDTRERCVGVLVAKRIRVESI